MLKATHTQQRPLIVHSPETMSDPLAEAKLQSHEIKFEIREELFDGIDLKAGVRNNARASEPINQHHVDELVVAIKNGAPIPMPVVNEQAGSLLYPLGGNHRFAAFRACGYNACKCYVTKITDTYLLELIPRILNRGHGLAQNEEEAIVHGMYLVKNFNNTIEVAAKEVGLKPSKLSGEILLRQRMDEMETFGINIKGLPKMSLKAIGRIRNQNVQAQLALIAHKQAPKIIGEIYDSLKDLKTEAAMLAKVAEWAKVYTKPQGRYGASRTPAKRVIHQAKSLLTVLGEHTTLNQLQLTDPADAEEFTGLCDRLRIKFDTILND